MHRSTCSPGCRWLCRILLPSIIRTNSREVDDHLPLDGWRQAYCSVSPSRSDPSQLAQQSPGEGKQD